MLGVFSLFDVYVVRVRGGCGGGKRRRRRRRRRRKRRRREGGDVDFGQYQDIIAGDWDNRVGFQKALKDAFEDFVNKDHTTTKSLAKFVEGLLNKRYMCVCELPSTKTSQILLLLLLWLWLSF